MVRKTALLKLSRRCADCCDAMWTLSYQKSSQINSPLPICFLYLLVAWFLDIGRMLGDSIGGDRRAGPRGRLGRQHHSETPEDPFFAFSSRWKGVRELAPAKLDGGFNLRLDAGKNEGAG